MTEGISYAGRVQIQQQPYGHFCRLCREPLSSDKYNLYRAWLLTKAGTLLANITRGPFLRSRVCPADLEDLLQTPEYNSETRRWYAEETATAFPGKWSWQFSDCVLQTACTIFNFAYTISCFACTWPLLTISQLLLVANYKLKQYIMALCNNSISVHLQLGSVSSEKLSHLHSNLDM